MALRFSSGLLVAVALIFLLTEVTIYAYSENDTESTSAQQTVKTENFEDIVILNKKICNSVTELKTTGEFSYVPRLLKIKTHKKHSKEDKKKFLSRSLSPKYASKRNLKDIVPVIEGISAIIGIADGVVDILQKLGVIPDQESEQFNQVLDAIGRNYDAIKEIGDKVNRNFAAMQAVYEIAHQTLFQIEETRCEMRMGFQRVLDSVTELKVDDKVSRISAFMRDFFSNEIYIIDNLSLKDRSEKLKELSRHVSGTGGVLHDNINDIIDQGLAIPNPSSAADSNENIIRLATFHTVYYGTQVSVSVVFFVIEQYSFLGGEYHDKGDLENFNKVYGTLQAQFQIFKTYLLNNYGLIDKVITLLETVQNMPLIINKREDIFELLPERINSLKDIKETLRHMKLPLITTVPRKITGVPDFSESTVKTPIGKWKEGVTISYAIQYRYNGTYSQVGEWSDPVIIHGTANPFITLPAAGEEGRERLIFRRFNNDPGELAGVLKDKDKIKFRDISRDVYDAAMRSDEEKGLEDMKILLNNGANTNEIFDKGRKAIHAAVQSGNLNITRYIFKLNESYINEQDVNGYTPIYIAAEAGYADFVKFLLENGADPNIKNNITNATLTPLHIAAYEGYYPVVEALMLCNKTDINAVDHSGFTPLHSAVMSDSVPTISALLRSNVTRVDAVSNQGLTPLHLSAINEGHTEAAQTLLADERTDVNFRSEGNLTALHFAASVGNLEVTRILAATTGTSINARSADGWSSLHLAVFSKNDETALELLKNEIIEVNAAGSNDITPLHIVAATGHKTVCLSLLEKGASTENITDDGLTPLHVASLQNNYEIATILIEHGANIEAKTINGSTPLHLSAYSGNINVTDILLSKGANTKAFDDNGYIPVHVAILNGKIETVKVLVNHENILVNVADEIGEYPLHLAAKSDYIGIAIINFLLSFKTDVNIQNKDGETPLHYAAKNDNSYAVEALAAKGGGLDLKDFTGWAPLQWAARNDCPNAVVSLAKVKADLNVRDNNSYAPLHLTALYNSPNATKAFAEVNADFNVRGANGSTPLHLGAALGNMDVIRCLIECHIEKKADVNSRNNFSETPLHVAIKNTQFEVIKYLVDNGADVNLVTTWPGYIRGEEGYASIHFAVKTGKLEIVKYLVEKGANATAATTIDKYTALHLAAIYGFFDIVKYLVEDKKVNVLTVDLGDRTALHYAAANAHFDIMKYLADRTTNIDAVDGSGRTPLHLSISDGLEPYKEEPQRLDQVKYLAQKGADCKSPVTLSDSFWRGYTPLLFAAENPMTNCTTVGDYTRCICLEVRLKIVKYLVEEKHVDLNPQTGETKSAPLHWAAGRCDEMALYLIDQGANVNIKDSESRTALHFAVERGTFEVMKSLVDHGADVNAKDKNKCTPLTYGKPPLPEIQEYIKAKGGISSCE